MIRMLHRLTSRPLCAKFCIWADTPAASTLRGWLTYQSLPHPRHWRTGRQCRPRSFPFADEEDALMRDFRDAKAMARALRDALKAKAIETTHAETLELIAKAFGYENWNILSAKIEAADGTGYVVSPLDGVNGVPAAIRLHASGFGGLPVS